MYMKKILLAMVALFVAVSSNAQMTDKPSGKGTFRQRVTNFWNNTKESVGDVVDKMSNDMDPNGLRRIKGKYYMHIYDEDLYAGSDANELKSLCRREFEAKYPGVTIVSVAIPMTEWFNATLEDNGKAVGFAQDLTCYILGKDGEDGYVNAKFVFERQKRVGQDYEKVDVKWPLWVSTDVLTPEIYQRLTKSFDSRRVNK